MIRLLFTLHRYLGMTIGIIMAIWCLSGFVMMYVPYPDISKNQQLAGLAPLQLQGCCDYSAIEDAKFVDVHRFRVEMLAGESVVRVFASDGRNPTLGLSSGKEIKNLSGAQATIIAREFQTQSGLAGEFETESIEQDQWTVTNYYERHRPLYLNRAELSGDTWYVSSQTGEVVQFTTSHQRFWNWLGAIPHWLYPTILRQFDDVWAQVIIVSSVLGTFLTIVGIYIGIRQWRRRLRLGRSLYRGMGWWHHYTGLVFGVLVLTWVFSGLLSMNPWNVFDFGGDATTRRNLEGIPLSALDMRDGIDRLAKIELPSDTVRVEGYGLMGKMYFLFYNRDGSYQRYDGITLQPSSVDNSEWQMLRNTVSSDNSVISAEIITQADAYYYSHKGGREFPVYRILLDDQQHSRIYLSPTTGELVSYVDRDMRWYRWLFAALHQGDFAAIVRSRPLWDIMMWLALFGVTLATVSGAYMGIKRWMR